ncbi:hypothetical protein ISN44_As05g048630 [Arabidopsis suecica]|uniref:Uncharacterized protein n=1 Tax=Arabidopsis suecica TaxID=45249 RepID=A0A8T2DL91_ARASU|nr:hypothetical protein ISN44_As05g048630 [Arabidopsis suecica]
MQLGISIIRSAPDASEDNRSRQSRSSRTVMVHQPGFRACLLRNQGNRDLTSLSDCIAARCDSMLLGKSHIINLSKNRRMPFKSRENTIFFSKRRKNSSLCPHCTAPPFQLSPTMLLMFCHDGARLKGMNPRNAEERKYRQAEGLVTPQFLSIPGSPIDLTKCWSSLLNIQGCKIEIFKSVFKWNVLLSTQPLLHTNESNYKTLSTAVRPPQQGRTEPSNDPLQHRMRPRTIVAVNHALAARSWFINQGKGPVS